MFTLQNQSVCVGKRVAAPSEMRISDGCQKTKKKKKKWQEAYAATEGQTQDSVGSLGLGREILCGGKKVSCKY